MVFWLRVCSVILKCFFQREKHYSSVFDMSFCELTILNEANLISYSLNHLFLECTKVSTSNEKAWVKSFAITRAMFQKMLWQSLFTSFRNQSDDWQSKSLEWSLCATNIDRNIFRLNFFYVESGDIEHKI